jgi:hypothetical protein
MSRSAKKNTQHTIMVYKGSKDVADWLMELAHSVGMPASITVDQALREFAHKRRFRPMPSRLARRGRLQTEGFQAIKGSLTETGLPVSEWGEILCPKCEAPMKVSAPHAGLDALVACLKCDVVALADRNVPRLLDQAHGEALPLEITQIPA